ncbi:class I SAM-dependent methyltransferase [Prosthecobacter vanneervenii]|uniref:16S rRNA (Guanine1207-N2)-methyltransferase n=1 Tax=Prosthecobacter vanneervenii TaxID=48466 RepID=A0A7W7Y8W2_9BACT|nr:methyltransferase [Prosthecobacter vanneervenii]MBB5031572.1 16S rRNA (guanine1207-N2)-methyltransferase [Prosthecobacter vanneervenii]
MSHALDALIFALDVTPDISTEGRVLFLRAQAHPALEHFEGRLVCQQTWKPFANQLQAAGHRVEREAHGLFDLVLVLPDPQRDLMVADLARAHDHLAPGGVLMAAVHNDAGSKRCEQHLREVAGHADTLSKHHSRVFWATKDEARPWKADMLERWRQGAAMRRILEGRFWSRPGLFNWDRIDEGSALLAKHLPLTLSGNVADFGCSWGFLSDHLLRHCHDIDSLDIYDADADCFECARRNLGLVPTRTKAAPHWQDITAGFDRTKFDAVVMNPPFHEGKEADPLIGLKFIAAAAQALRPEGHLWLVANRQLPYENLLTETFAQMEKVVETGGFKVLHASHPIVKHSRAQRGKRRR